MHLALIIWPSRMNQPWPASISVAASLPTSSCALPARPSSDLTARKAAESILRDSGHRCTDRKVNVNLHRPGLEPPASRASSSATCTPLSGSSYPGSDTLLPVLPIRPFLAQQSPSGLSPQSHIIWEALSAPGGGSGPHPGVHLSTSVSGGMHISAAFTFIICVTLTEV